MKKVGSASFFTRLVSLVFCNGITVAIQIVFMLAVLKIFQTFGLGFPWLNEFFILAIVIIHLIPLYVMYFGDKQMLQAKRWYLKLDDNLAENENIKTSDKLKLYFKEFGKRELLVTVIPLICLLIGVFLDIKGCGFICIPAGAFVDIIPLPIAIVLGWVLFYTEYLLALILRFKKWDKDRLHKQGANI